MFAASLQALQSHAAQRHHAPAPTPSPQPAVIAFSVIKADGAANFIHRFYPRVHLLVDRDANALIISATPEDLNAIRQIAGGIDTKSPLAPVTQSVTLHRISGSEVEDRLRSLYPQSKFSALGRHTLLISASNADMQQMQALIAAIDAPAATPTPSAAATPPDTEAVHVFQGNPRRIAREVAGAVRGLRVSVAGQAVVLSGPSDVVSRAKDLIAVLDAPPAGQRYTAAYRIRTLDAASVGELIQRSFPDAKVGVDEDINSISVLAAGAEQQRIADAIERLDSEGTAASNSPMGQAAAAAAASGNGSVQVYTLKAALPGAGGAPSTSANDLASLVTQALQPQAPDLHITVSPETPQMILNGSPYSIKMAKDLLSQLDVSQKLVVLDTEILEVDENTAKNLGISVASSTGGPFSVGTIFTEMAPPADANGATPALRHFQPFFRTPLAFGVAINLAIQHGNARVLADPRITTLSGHTATIRAGDNISIPLTVGGGAGTIATTQIQTFQTGVTLDITPMLNADGLITVALHPVVNSLTGILNGVPQISTRDTQTTVALKEDETLVIGGLIQDNTQRTESKIPILGDLPLVGPVFRNQTLNGDRNELILSVTPHIVNPGQINVYPGPPLPAIPTPAPLPTLPPGATLPAETPTPQAAPSPAGLPTPPPPPPILSATPIDTQKVTAPGENVSASPSPSPTPTLASMQNTFVFGTPPPQNNASNSDPVRIYYVKLTPTFLAYGQAVSVTAITSSNVAQVSLSYNGVSLSIPQTGPGQWQAVLPFTLIGNPPPTGGIMLNLIASRSDGTQVSVPIPVIIGSQ